MMRYMDHNGCEFKTFTSMCKHYGKSPQMVRARLKDGLTLKEALTLEDRRQINKSKSSTFKDHLGNEFENIDLAAEHYGLMTATLKYRLKSGWGLEEAITTPVYKSTKRNREKICVDHLGNTYRTKQEMVDHYGISLGALWHRIDRGWSLADALTKPIQQKGCLA